MTKEGVAKRYAESPHILVIDDDERICALVSRYLQEHDFVTVTAQSADMAHEIMTYMTFDALVVDVMMPGEDGFSFTRSLRDKGNDIPVMLLTALSEVDDRVTGLQKGADDYLSKPFDPRELVLRLQAILRRRPVPKEDDGARPVRIGDWVYDPVQNELCCDIDDRVQRLTAVEGNLLKALSMNLNDVISRERLAELCNLEGSERAIDVQVTRLRKKIEQDSKAPRYLQTVRGKGYILRAEAL